MEKFSIEDIKAPVYIGVFLDTESQKHLFSHATLEDQDPDKFAHHITLVPPGKVTSERVAEFIPFLGKEVKFNAHGVIQGEAKGGRVESALIKDIALRDDTSLEVPYHNEAYTHVTLSRDNVKVPPVSAGQLDPDKTSKEKIDLTLTGRIGFFYSAHHIAYSLVGAVDREYVEEFQKIRGYKKLVICDFDSTLFNSPIPPVGWGNPKTLEISSFKNGEKDIEKGFNNVVLNAMKDRVPQPDVYTVLITGRQPAFRKLLQKIIGPRVNFKGMFFSDGSKTLDFKKGCIGYLINKLLPDLKEVEVWEDRRGQNGDPDERHLQEFLKYIEDKGLKATEGFFTVADVEDHVQFTPEVQAELEARLKAIKEKTLKK